MKGSLYTIVYAVIVGTFCAALLTGAAEFTRPFREANQRAEEMRNILGVLDVPFAPGASAEELVQVFDNHVRRETFGPLTAYRLITNEEEVDAGAVAIEFEGSGAWGPIRGFLALESDWETIRGITFHDHQETPGLGGEIDTAAFREQFRGQPLLAPDGSPAVRIVRDGADDPGEVDAISGATITCDRVEVILRRLAEQIDEVHP